MRRTVVVLLACMAPSIAHGADGCLARELWGIELDAAEQSLSPGTRAYMEEIGAPEVNSMVDEPRRILEDAWLVGVLCELQDLLPGQGEKAADSRSPKDDTRKP